jgi:hypothetical protein
MNRAIVAIDLQEVPAVLAKHFHRKDVRSGPSPIS